MDGVKQLTDVIQVCTDGSQLSEKGVDTAVELAKSLNLPLLGMTAVSGSSVGVDIKLVVPCSGISASRFFDNPEYSSF